MSGELKSAGCCRKSYRKTNATTRTDNFVPKDAHLLVMHPLATSGSRGGKVTKTVFQPYLDLCRAMLPRRTGRELAGRRALEEIQVEGASPWDFGPYELSSADDDTGRVLMKLWWRTPSGTRMGRMR